jgi:hypothetical protein
MVHGTKGVAGTARIISCAGGVQFACVSRKP